MHMQIFFINFFALILLFWVAHLSVFTSKLFKHVISYQFCLIISKNSLSDFVWFFSKSSSPPVLTFPVAPSGRQPPLLKKFKMATMMRQQRHPASPQPLKNRFQRQQQLIGVYTTRGKYISNDDALTPTFCTFFTGKVQNMYFLIILTKIKWHKRLFACTYSIHTAFDSGMQG